MLLSVVTFAVYVFSAIFVAFSLYCLHWYASIPRNLPPGPIGLPFVGCFPWVRSWSAHLTLTNWSRTYGPVFSFYQGSKLVVVLADAQVLDEALIKHADSFSGRPSLMGVRPKTIKPKHGINSSEGELWKEQRRFLVGTLRNFGVGRPLLESQIVDEAESLRKAIGRTDGAPFDPKPLISNAVSNIICWLVFGHRFELNSELRLQLDKLNYRASQSRRNTLSAQSIFPWFQRYWPTAKRELARFVQDGEDIMRFLQNEIDQCRSSFRLDETPTNFVHAFLQARATDAGRFFTDEQLRSECFDLFLAGTDTTVSTLRWAVYYVIKYPAVQNQVRDEIQSVLGSRTPSYADRNRLPFTEATLMEVQRHATIAPFALTHRTTNDVRVFGYDLPESTYVLPLIWAVHRNDGRFPDPERFDPNRFLVENDGDLRVRKDLPFVPFSVGKRACPGESLAKTELFIYFVVMLQTFAFSFPPDENYDEPLDSTVGFIRSPVAFNVCATPVT